MLFLNRLKENCDTYADKTAIEYLLPGGTETVSYGQLETRVQQTMAYLQSLGVQPGDRVAALLKNSIEFVETYFAAAKIGAVMVPVNWRLVAAEIGYILDDSGAAVL